MAPRGDVAKWSKAVVCKTIIRRFKSARRLHLLLLASALGCSDPPSPPPVRTDAASTAPWVEWKADDAPVTRPIALIVDTPGGALDRIVADPDVTTFLNDQFHPVFRAAWPGQPTGTVAFLTPRGCALGPTERPASTADFIRIANAVIVRPEARDGRADRLSLTCPPP